MFAKHPIASRVNEQLDAAIEGNPYQRHRICVDQIIWSELLSREVRRAEAVLRMLSQIRYCRHIDTSRPPC